MSYSGVGKRKSKIVLLACLMLALIGSSVISTGEAFRFEYSNNDSMYSGRYFSSINHTVDWLAEEILTLRKARGYSNSMLRKKLLCVFTFAGTIAIAIHLAEASLKTKNDNTTIVKNPVLLKLRI